MKMTNVLKAVLVAGLILTGHLVTAATIEVSTVAQLTNALDVAQRSHSSDTILLKKGFYDVSSCAMMRDNGSGVIVDSCSHIAVCDKCVLKGETDDPRDTATSPIASFIITLHQATGLSCRILRFQTDALKQQTPTVQMVGASWGGMKSALFPTVW